MLNEVLRTDGCRNSAELRPAAEELAAGTHEFEEVRLLDRCPLRDRWAEAPRPGH